MLVIFADLDRINDAAPTAFEVKDRHIQHEHRIMLTPPLLKVVPQLISYFVLFNVVVVHTVSFLFHRANTNNPSKPRTIPMRGLKIANQSDKSQSS